MISICSNIIFSGIYAEGMSYFLRTTALDQKVFDFATPLFMHAFAFGACYSAIYLAIKISFQDDIRDDPEKYSQYPIFHNVNHVVANIISALASAYLMRQDNYSFSYRFAAICMVPFVIFSAAKTY